ncbi:MAG: alpha/beta hydrolase [Candidatus Micrarchaeota archaeon]|nr:alpha/beta hydrolase [Candidatus Micrarchaeota archaeon]
MARRVIIIHGFQSEPMHGFRPWLKKELEARGFEVSIPAMPNPNEPKVEEWVATIDREVGQTGDGCILLGHSLGCIAILRYLERADVKVRGVVLVAGFIGSLGGEFSILDEFVRAPVDAERVKKACKKIIAIFSDNDPYVPLEQAKLIEKKLGAKTIVLHARGHFSSSDGTTKLPEALEAILEISN